MKTERWDNGTVVHLPTLCMSHVQGVAGGLPILIQAALLYANHTKENL
jgi:hypothetical protein